MQILLENDFARVVYQEEGHFITFRYKKFGTSVQFREAWTQAADFAIEKQVSRWLSDSVEMGPIHPKDQQWFSEEWTPRVREAVREETFVAVVLSDKIFAQVSSQRIMEEAQKQNQEVRAQQQDLGRLHTAFFQDSEKAIAWLVKSHPQ
ncbi:MAG: hypothetical protein OHK0053_18850 [Microscillaceae bacterium]